MKRILFILILTVIVTSAQVSTSLLTGSNPILVIKSGGSDFGAYYAEILRSEGLNAFDVTDISTVTSSTLTGYDLVILGETTLSSSQVSMFTNWVTAGGRLIAMHPDKQLASLLGLSDAGATLSNAYLLVNTASSPGAGIVDQTIQFHGAADLYQLNGARGVATLYSNASTATSYPAVTLNNVVAGQAAAFVYDLARSVVYTRQGNPAWAGQQRDGFNPTRPDDQFYGAAWYDPQPDWIDLTKVAVPQADEQQRLLANMIETMESKPLPRFWYFPSGYHAVVIMTGDDHSNGGTPFRFNQYIAKSPAGCSVANWQCIRSTSYIYAPDTAYLTDSIAASFNAQGFEIALHPLTNCLDWPSQAWLDATFVSQLANFALNYPSLPAPTTSRTHCLVWSDWMSQPKVELNHGIRFDTNYYYWPPAWINDRPGFFTGSGMPMRFADVDGTIVDVYQGATYLTDESGQTYPFEINKLLDNAIGSLAYYAAITVQAHTDSVDPTFPGQIVSDAVVGSAQTRGVPVVSARQMLGWLDGRNGSSFTGISWLINTLNFTIKVGAATNGLQAMVPTTSSAGTLKSITLNGAPVTYTTQTIKGISYAFFTAGAGSCAATYGP